MKSTRRSGIILTLMLAATLALLIPNAAIAGDHLHKHDCLDGQVLKSQGGEWTCSDDNNIDTLGDLPCSAGQVAKFSNVSNMWECAEDETGSNAGTNIEIVQNSNGYGWFNGITRIEPNTGFRVTIEKDFAETPLRIVLNDQVGSNGTGCGVSGAIEVQIDDGSGFKTISKPGPCSQTWYNGNDYTWDIVNLDCLATNLPAGTYEFRVVYSCTSSCGNDCHLGNSFFSNQDGSKSFQRRLIVEELR